jgi:hypothetical protein
MSIDLEHYATIGKTLLVCEAGTVFQAGIPMLLPCREVRSLSRNYEGPLDDYIRISLVGVPTAALESYCEDLEAYALGEAQSAPLCINPHPAYVRWGGLILLAFFAGIIPTAIVALLGNFPLWCVFALFFLFVIAFALLLLPQFFESNRRLSFHLHLHSELLRRRGQGPLKGKGVFCFLKSPRSKLAQVKTEGVLSRDSGGIMSRRKSLSVFICSLFTLTILTVAAPCARAAEKEKKTEEGKVENDSGSLTGKDGSDYVCEADISYTWQPKPPARQGKKTKAAAEQEPAPEKMTVFFSTLGSHGLVPEEVERRLHGQLANIKAKALQHCRRRHEDQASCLASGMRSQFSEYNKLDFAARSALLSALKEDCRQSFGRCLSAEASPPKCFVNRPSDLPKQEAKEEKKDEKKKGQ